MFQRGLVILSVILIDYILYKVVPLIIGKYFTSKPTPVEQFRAQMSVPAPVVSSGLPPPPEPPRLVAPGGPNPPSAAPPKSVTFAEKRIPDETASDSLVETNTEVPMKDNLRHPERMFSAPVANTGTKQAVQSGISGPTADSPSPSGKFSNDFAQNGGEFMSGVFAHDLNSTGENFAEI